MICTTLHNPPSPQPLPPHCVPATPSLIVTRLLCPQAFALAVHFARNTFLISAPDELLLTIWVSSQVPPVQGGPPGLPCLEGISADAHVVQSLAITSFISILVLFLLEIISFMCVYYLSPLLDHQFQDLLSVLFFGVPHCAPCLKQCPADRRCSRNISGSKADINE